MTRSSGTVVMVGSINADQIVRVPRLPRPGETTLATGSSHTAGGKSANQAVASARIAPTALLGAVGRDEAGDHLLQQIAAQGVDVSRVVRTADASTAQALVLVDDSGENFIVVVPGANAHASTAGLDAGLLAEAAVVCLCLEVADDVLLDAADRARGSGVTVVLNASPVRPLPPALLEAVDVLVVNEHELAALARAADGRSRNPDTGTDTDTDTDTELTLMRRTLGVPHLVVTLGGRGAVAISADSDPVACPAPTVTPADTSGCGDAFLGTLAAQLAGGLTCSEALALATAVASLAATRAGTQASYPTLAEAEACARDLPIHQSRAIDDSGLD